MKERKLDITGLKSTADQIAHLVGRGFRIMAVVGGGALGEEYVKTARKFSKHADIREIKNSAAEVDSLLLIAGLRQVKIPVNAAPILDPRRLEEFLDNQSWKVAVLANTQGKLKSMLVGVELAKKYHAAIMHVATMRQAIDRRI